MDLFVGIRVARPSPRLRCPTTWCMSACPSSLPLGGGLGAHAKSFPAWSSNSRAERT